MLCSSKSGGKWEERKADFHRLLCVCFCFDFSLNIPCIFFLRVWRKQWKRSREKKQQSVERNKRTVPCNGFFSLYFACAHRFLFSVANRIVNNSNVIIGGKTNKIQNPKNSCFIEHGARATQQIGIKLKNLNRHSVHFLFVDLF